MATGGGSSGNAQRKYENYVEEEEMQQLVELIHDSVVGLSSRYDSDSRHSSIVSRIEEQHMNEDDSNKQQQQQLSTDMVCLRFD